MPTYGFPIQTHCFNAPLGGELMTVADVTPSVGRLLGIMLAPAAQDEAKREAITVSWWKETRPLFDKSSEASVSWGAKETEALLNTPDLTPTLDAAGARDAYKYGVMSGYIVGWCVFRAQYPDIASTASMGAALRMIEEATGAHKIRGYGASHLKQNKWPEFRPVAHLWAAYIIERTSKKYGYGEQFLHGVDGSVPRLIGVSEYIRKLGTAHRAKSARSTDSLLSEIESWRLDPEDSTVWSDVPVTNDRKSAEFWDLRKHPFRDWYK